MVVFWIIALVAGAGLVVYGLGPVLQTREQRKLIRVQEREISNAANEGSGLLGVSAQTRAPGIGDPVGILEIGRIRLQQVLVEGVGSSQTRKGPGHVPGTAGVGQPGNSVVVGRAHGFAGPFGDLLRLSKDDPILVTTRQGQSVYRVTSVTRVALPAGPSDDAASAGTSIDEVYGPAPGDQITLVTSGSPVPWNHTRAIVVVATLVGQPFAPTPQNGRSDAQSGVRGERAAAATVVLSLLLYGGVMGATVLLYQRFRPVTAYILTIGPVVAATIVAGESLSRLLPSWS